MMREILFRARWKDTNKNIIPNFMNDYELESLNSDNLIVDQYIGVCDSRNKEIFEGDILLVICDGIRSVHGVIWGGKDYPAYSLYPSLDVDCNDFSQIENAGGYKTRVIGNIHENPELLEASQ